MSELQELLTGCLSGSTAVAQGDLRVGIDDPLSESGVILRGESGGERWEVQSG